MSGFKRIMAEMHGRSLWQVLGLYLGGSWVALQVVEQLTQAAGLPDWVHPFSLVLLILGFPMVMATAFVQHGMRGGPPGARARAAESGETPEASGSEMVADPQVEWGPVPVRPAADASVSAPAAAPDSSHGVGHRLLTWRNAILGGVGAFALLGLLTVGYLVARSIGIGPAGTLVAQGVLEEGAPVILADFESADPELAEVVTGALRIDLFESDAIRVVERGDLAGALRRMQRPQDARITPDAAREIATREGYGAVIEGDVGTAGSGYVLAARIVSPDGSPLAAFRETARSEDGLIDAIEDLSRSIRDKAGESLRSVQSAPPLQRVSTASLDALRAYTRGEALSDAGDNPAALKMFERAVEIDPEFAMAYRKIGVALSNMGIRRSDEIAAVRRAYELRERLPESERYLAEAYYYGQVTGDREAAIRAYESQLALDPQNTAALNNLGNLYRVKGRLEEAADLYIKALEVEKFPVAYTNLAYAYWLLGRPAETERTLDSAIVHLPEATFVFEYRRVVRALDSGDYERADSLLRAYEERFPEPPIARVWAATARFRRAMLEGRQRAAEAEIPNFQLAESGASNPTTRVFFRAGMHRQRGDVETAAGVFLDALEELRDSVAAVSLPYAAAIDALLETGQVSRAEALHAEWQAAVSEDELGAGGQGQRRATEARFARARGEYREALSLIDAYEARCPASCAVEASAERAGVYEEAEDAARAIEAWEAWLEAREARSFDDAFGRGPTLERLGQLYDEAGDLENAAKYYAMFVELWAEADEELQPRVRAAQARLEAIVRKRG